MGKLCEGRAVCSRFGLSVDILERCPDCCRARREIPPAHHTKAGIVRWSSITPISPQILTWVAVEAVNDELVKVGEEAPGTVRRPLPRKLNSSAIREDTPRLVFRPKDDVPASPRKLWRAA
jgi:hypothetical protein